MYNLISKSTGLMAIFAALVITPVMSQSAIAQAVPTQAAMSDCNKNASQTTGESVEDEAISHNGHIHRRKKDKPATENSSVLISPTEAIAHNGHIHRRKKDQNAAIVPSQEVEQLVSHNGHRHRKPNNNA